MAATDAACAHPRVDGTRTAAMGGSFGGYMANWIAGHTDRFDAIVTHASLWALDQFGPTTDGAYWWRRNDRRDDRLNTPHRHVGASARRCWSSTATRTTACRSAKVCGSGTSCSPSRHCLPGTTGAVRTEFYFPTEGHWVIAPQHAKVWYQAVTAFLGRHVRGER